MTEMSAYIRSHPSFVMLAPSTVRRAEYTPAANVTRRMHWAQLSGCTGWREHRAMPPQVHCVRHDCAHTVGDRIARLIVRVHQRDVSRIGRRDGAGEVARHRVSTRLGALAGAFRLLASDLHPVVRVVGVEGSPVHNLGRLRVKDCDHKAALLGVDAGNRLMRLESEDSFLSRAATDHTVATGADRRRRRGR